jgi:hypothetical protein
MAMPVLPDERPPPSGPRPAGQQQVHHPRRQSGQQGGHQDVDGPDLPGFLADPDGQVDAGQPGNGPDGEGHGRGDGDHDGAAAHGGRHRCSPT